MKPFIDFGEPTYRHYYIYQAFESKEQTIARWKNDIMERGHMDRLMFEPEFHAKTDYSNFSIEWRAKAQRRIEGISMFRSVRFTIGLYRDGFHINVDLSDLPMDIERALKYKVFGDLNRSNGFTKDVAKVAPITNAIFEHIIDFLDNYKDANT